MIKKNNENGYIAITAAIVLGAVLLALVISFSLLIFLSRQGIVNTQFKERSNFLARSCLEKALLEMAKVPSYLGSELVTVGSEQCSIAAIESTPPTNIIRTSATVGRSQTNLKLTVDSDLNTVSLEEE